MFFQKFKKITTVWPREATTEFEGNPCIRFIDNCDTDEGRATDKLRFHELCWHSQADLKIHSCQLHCGPFHIQRASIKLSLLLHNLKVLLRELELLVWRWCSVEMYIISSQLVGWKYVNCVSIFALLRESTHGCSYFMNMYESWNTACKPPTCSTVYFFFYLLIMSSDGITAVVSASQYRILWATFKVPWSTIVNRMRNVRFGESPFYLTASLTSLSLM